MTEIFHFSWIRQEDEDQKNDRKITKTFRVFKFHLNVEDYIKRTEKNVEKIIREVAYDEKNIGFSV